MYSSSGNQFISFWISSPTFFQSLAFLCATRFTSFNFWYAFQNKILQIRVSRTILTTSSTLLKPCPGMFIENWKLRFTFLSVLVINWWLCKSTIPWRYTIWAAFLLFVNDLKHDALIITFLNSTRNHTISHMWRLIASNNNSTLCTKLESHVQCTTTSILRNQSQAFYYSLGTILYEQRYGIT